ncbi:LEA type 2 family protein [Myxococcota bacterium]|nr:LEA type 2 family protein [Myxococcota bacterium]
MMLRFVASIPVAVLFAAACASTPPPPAKPQGEVLVEVERVMPKTESLDAAAVEVSLKLSNLTDTPLRIERVDFEVDTAEVSGVLKGSSPSAGDVGPSQSAVITFGQSIPFPTEKDAYEKVLEKGSIPADLKGAVVLADGRKITFEKKGEVAAPTLPKFIVHHAQAARYEKDAVDVTLLLRLVNENSFPVSIDVVKYTVYIEGKKVKSEQAALGERLIQGGASEYEVGVEMDPKTVDKVKLKKVLDSGRVGYKVSGKVVLPRLDIPFEHTGEIDIGTASSSED